MIEPASRGYMPVAESVEWETPAYLFQKIAEEFGPFDLDPAATEANAKAPRWFTESDDGLAEEWRGRVFVNPPYGHGLGRWIAKMAEEVGAGRAILIVALLPARTGTKWFHDFILGKTEVRFLKGRVKYGAGRAPAPFDSMIVVFRGSLPAAAAHGDGGFGRDPVGGFPEKIAGGGVVDDGAEGADRAGSRFFPCHNDGSRLGYKELV